MVHPRVLRWSATTPSVHRLRLRDGAERIAMVKYGITDIRQFYANDPRFLEQFVS